ncbi:MAG: hypothetical protein RL651_1960 [Pseudomonadota bacterium]|jgi:hypothetical protein
MKKMLMAWLLVASCNAFAVSNGEIQAGYAEMNRACSPSNSGSQASRERECAAAGRVVEQNSRQLMNDMAQSMAKRDQERQRIQQEEIWREQARRGYRY